MTPAPKSRIDAPSLLAQIGRRLFPFRLAFGIAAVLLGALFVRPGRLFGAYEIPGTVLSFCLVLLGLGLRAWAAAHAGGHTRSGSIEAPRLATGGPYAHVRNPIYLGSIVLGLGMVGLLGDPYLFPLYFTVFAVLYLAIIPAEEEFLRATFGAEYDEYCAAVPRLIPRLRPWPGADRRPAGWRAARGDLVIGLLLAGIYAAMRLVQLASER